MGTLHARQSSEELEELIEELAPRYNIAPSHTIKVVGMNSDGKRRGLANLKWGLVPNWANSPKEASINARSETAANLPSFEDSFKRRRCLIPTDGFYERKKMSGKNKQPYHIRKKDQGLFAFAGIWDIWKDDRQKLSTAAILTGEPNELVREIHDRMPVIIPGEHFAAWLNSDTTLDVIKSLCVPFPAAAMEEVPVSQFPEKTYAGVPAPGPRAIPRREVQTA